MNSKIHLGSLQGTLLATPASTISNFSKCVRFWVSPGVPKAINLSPDGSPKATKLSKNWYQKPLQRKLPGTLSSKTPFKRNLHRVWKTLPHENTAIYCTGAIFSHPWSRTSFVNLCCPKGWAWVLFWTSFASMWHPQSTKMHTKNKRKKDKQTSYLFSTSWCYWWSITFYVLSS